MILTLKDIGVPECVLSGPPQLVRNQPEPSGYISLPPPGGAALLPRLQRSSLLFVSKENFLNAIKSFSGPLEDIKLCMYAANAANG